MNTLNIIQKNTILYSAIIVVICWAFLEGWFPFVRRQWIFLGLGLVASFFTSQKFFQTKRFQVLMGYMLVIFLNVLAGDKYFPGTADMLIEIFSLAFPAALLVYAYNSTRKDIIIILFSFFFVLIISAWASLLIDKFMIPGAIRQMTMLHYLEGKDSVYAYYRLGLSSYSFPHALPILVPPLVMGVKSKKIAKKLKLKILFLLVSTLLLVWLSGIMTALLLTILFLLMSYFTHEDTIWRNIRRLSIIFIMFLPLLSPTVMRPVARYAMEITGEESDYYKKIADYERGLASEYASGGDDWESRQNLYDQSLSGFTENIIWGSNSKVGGHSSFLDRLGVLGLLGFIPLIWFFFLQLKAGAMQIPLRNRIYYFEGCLAGIMMLSLKSAFYPVFFIVLFIILPLISSFISGKENR